VRDQEENLTLQHSIFNIFVMVVFRFACAHGATLSPLRCRQIYLNLELSGTVPSQMGLLIALRNV
jgi:hypothetical protein